MLDGVLSFSDPWTLAEDQLHPTSVSTDALFATSNGLLGVSGRRREPVGEDGGGALVLGCYETRPYAHPEAAFGFPDDYQTIVIVTDPTFVQVTVDGVRVATDSGTWLEHRRWLDLRTGLVSTSGTWCSPAGRSVRIASERMASVEDPSLLWTSVEVEPADDGASVEITMELRANTGDSTFPDEPEAISRAWGRVFVPEGTLDDDGCTGLVHRTRTSGRAIACVVAHDAPGRPVDQQVDSDSAKTTFRIEARPGHPARVVQRAGFSVGEGPGADLLADAAATVRRAAGTGFTDAIAAQRRVYDRFWDGSAVDVDGDPDMEGAIRYSAFQTFQANVLRPDGAGPAKALTGQGYQGHHMWDQEVYVGHALSLLWPEAARSLLEFRYRTLPAARDRARELSLDGAQYPWRTIDGTEASSLLPAGPAQHHVNAAVAWGVGHHLACTGDTGWMDRAGVEVLVETARAWLSLGHFAADGSFRIETVTGPDEYTGMVDNNLYTNAMAASNLELAASQIEEMRDRNPAAHEALVAKVSLRDGEPEAWRAAAAVMYLPHDGSLGVSAQDHSFLDKPRWDLEQTPSELKPLQDHHHLLTLYRHQVLKQADVVLANVLQRDRFTPEQRRRDFDYYEPLTAHDSSLSAPIHAIAAADVGHTDKAWEFTCDAALTDLDERFGTPDHGIHLAAAAGTWLAVARGFGGLEIHDGVPVLDPSLPASIDGLRFRFRFRSALVEVDIRREATAYRLLDGDRLRIRHRQDDVSLDPGETVQRPT